MKIKVYIVQLSLVIGLAGALLTGILSPKDPQAPLGIASPYNLLFVLFLLMLLFGMMVIICNLAGHNDPPKSHTP